VYDLSGRLVYSQSLGTMQSGTYSRTIGLGSLPGGTYILKLNYTSGSSYGKAIKLN
jgi:hypothetical protein